VLKANYDLQFGTPNQLEDLRQQRSNLRALTPSMPQGVLADPDLQPLH
jgi:hypothetical protein